MLPATLVDEKNSSTVSRLLEVGPIRSQFEQTH